MNDAPGTMFDTVGFPLPVDWVDLGTASLRYVHLPKDQPGDQSIPLVLLHEMGGTLETWDLTIPLLAPHHEIIALDWRGFGYSEKVSGTITLPDHVADLTALLDARGITGPVMIAGVAVGAAIACGFAAAHPERVAGLVLISPALEIAAAKREERLADIAVLEFEGMRAAVVESLAGGYPERFRNGDGRFEQFRARWLANDPESFAATYRMLLDLDIDPVLAEVQCPVRLVAGEYDLVRNPVYVQGVADRISNSHVVTVLGGHHMPHQVPQIVADQLLQFAANLSTGGN